MKTSDQPETLSELLRTLEKSGDLRSLARTCGLSVRELRRRLAIWRREVQETAGVAEKSSKKAKDTETDPDRWPSLPLAAEMDRSPLPARSREVLEIFTDGASRGNPGPAAAGMVFRQKGGPNLCEHCEALGRTTNNVAEYRAVVIALEHCRRWQVKRVHLFLDSELIVRQINGAYRVKSPDLRPLYQQVIFLSKDLEDFRVTHVPRSHNAHADALANKALDAL